MKIFKIIKLDNTLCILYSMIFIRSIEIKKFFITFFKHDGMMKHV